MRDLKGLVRLSKAVPDYTFDFYWARVIQKRLENYYIQRGNRNVKVWIETEETPTGRKIYNVRSNILFITPTL
jgi:hypothetical protein